MRLAASTEVRAGSGLTDDFITSPLALNHIKLLREADGTVAAVGEVTNPTTTTLTFAEVTISFYSGSTLLGRGHNYVFTSNNVQISATGVFAPALPQAGIGVFRIFSSVEFDAVTSYTFDSDASSFLFTAAVADVRVKAVAFSLNAAGGTNVVGTVLNAGSQSSTYSTLVSLVGYLDGSIADVTFAYVSGVSVECGGATRTSVVPSGRTAPFFLNFLHPVDSVSRATVNWSEFSISPTASFPSSAGSGSIRVAADCDWSAVSPLPVVQGRAK